jgi:hypothetical protein
VIKQIHNQLCLLAGKRVVLLEQTGSTTPAPPGRLVGQLFKVVKNWSGVGDAKTILPLLPQGSFNVIPQSTCKGYSAH